MKTSVSNLNGENWSGDQFIYIDDINGRIVGYDMDQQCCEYSDHGVWSQNENFDFDSAVFCEPFVGNVNDDFESIKDAMLNMFKIPSDEYLDVGGTVSFNLVDKNGVEGVLILVNSHNGFYYHEYQVIENNKIKSRDYI